MSSPQDAFASVSFVHDPLSGVRQSFNAPAAHWNPLTAPAADPHDAPTIDANDVADSYVDDAPPPPNIEDGGGEFEFDEGGLVDAASCDAASEDTARDADDADAFDGH
jgi:hypothetical protein